MFAFGLYFVYVIQYTRRKYNANDPEIYFASGEIIDYTTIFHLTGGPYAKHSTWTDYPNLWTLPFRLVPNWRKEEFW